MASDAPSPWGCGAWHRERWFQLAWDGRSAHLSIMVKELIPIVLACAIWGHVWGTHRVICHCDNQAVVACIHSRTSRDSRCMHILHTLAFIEGRHSFSLHPNTLTLEQTTSSTISHETISLPSSIRYPRAITDPPLSRPSCWSCFWTQHWIGSHLTGSGCLEVLSRGDLTVDHPPAIIKFLLKWSKTNQAGRGADVVLGRTGLPLCLVAAVMAYIAK